MATKVQFEVFREAYEAEKEHYAQVEARAKLYLTIITFYLGAVAFKFSDVLTFMKTYGIPATLYIAGGVLLLLALLLTILATRIRTYEAAYDLRHIIESFKEVPPTDSEFLDARLVDYTIATERNRAMNNRVAKLLSGSSWLLFSAIFLQLAVFFIAFYKSPR
jgi:hypothetical protein